MAERRLFAIRKGISRLQGVLQLLQGNHVYGECSHASKTEPTTDQAKHQVVRRGLVGVCPILCNLVFAAELGRFHASTHPSELPTLAQDVCKCSYNVSLLLQHH